MTTHAVLFEFLIDVAHRDLTAYLIQSHLDAFMCDEQPTHTLSTQGNLTV